MSSLAVINLIIATFIILGGPLGVIFYFEARERVHRRKLDDVSYAVQFEPPEGLTPTEVGVLVDDQAHVRDILATIFDLANRGYMRIREVRSGSGNISFELALLKSDFREDIKLKPHESYIMGLFLGAGNLCLLEDVLGSGVLKSAREAIEKRVFGQLTVLGFYSGRPVGKAANHFKQVLMGLLSPMMMLMFVPSFGENIMVVILYSIFVSAFFAVWLSMIYGRINHAVTDAGLDARRQALGFREYLMRAEKFRLEWQIGKQVFGEYMPYALAFDVLGPFIEAEANYFDAVPDWFEGTHMAEEVERVTRFVSDVAGLAVLFGATVNEFLDSK